MEIYTSYKTAFSIILCSRFCILARLAKKAKHSPFFEKGIFKWFQYIQLLFVIRGFTLAGLKALLLQKYGVDGYNQMLIYRQVTEWFFSLLIMGLFLYTNVPISKIMKQKKLKEKIENA